MFFAQNFRLPPHSQNNKWVNLIMFLTKKSPQKIICNPPKGRSFSLMSLPIKSSLSSRSSDTIDISSMINTSVSCHRCNACEPRTKSTSCLLGLVASWTPAQLCTVLPCICTADIPVEAVTATLRFLSLSFPTRLLSRNDLPTPAEPVKKILYPTRSGEINIEMKSCYANA